MTFSPDCRSTIMERSTTTQTPTYTNTTGDTAITPAQNNTAGNNGGTRNNEVPITSNEVDDTSAQLAPPTCGAAVAEGLVGMLAGLGLLSVISRRRRA